ATTVNGVSLAAGAVTRPLNSVGQWLTISFTVTNTGGVSVSGITATVFAGPGAGLAAFVSGPLPPGPVTLAAGSATTFVWTYSTSGAGLAVWSLSVTGVPACGGLPPTVLGAAAVSATMQTPAVLTASLAPLTSPVCIGTNFLVVLTVTNTGQATATGVAVPAV